MKSLARNIGAAVLGWVTMTVGVFILMTIMWTILGSEGAFLPQSWDVSPTWLAGSVGVGLLAGICGGLMAAVVGEGRWGVRLLVTLVLVLGGVTAVMLQMGLAGASAEAGPRPVEVGMLVAMNSAQQPLWVAWLNPLIGAFGALLGARLIPAYRRGKPSPEGVE